MNTDKKINQYYVDIVMNKPNYIEVNNSYKRYCLIFSVKSSNELSSSILRTFNLEIISKSILIFSIFIK